MLSLQGIPLDDFIMPSIENGHYQTTHCYEHRLAKKYRDDIYHVPQVGLTDVPSEPVI